MLKKQKRGLQLNYSKKFSKYMYDEESRKRKALRAIATFEDYMNKKTNDLNVMEVGSATGILTYFLSFHFKKVYGIDVDETAMKFAKKNYKRENIEYILMDGLKMSFKDNFFDTIVCHHTYEHVSDSNLLFEEIYRVLKPGGVIHFGAPNKLMLKESHYGIYLLSWWPRAISTLILKVKNLDNYYYEDMKTYWGILKLLKKFKEIKDYTSNCILEPDKYYSNDVVNEYKWIRKIPNWLLKIIIPLAPDFVILAKK